MDNAPLSRGGHARGLPDQARFPPHRPHPDDRTGRRRWGGRAPRAGDGRRAPGRRDLRRRLLVSGRAKRPVPHPGPALCRAHARDDRPRGRRVRACGRAPRDRLSAGDARGRPQRRRRVRPRGGGRRVHGRSGTCARRPWASPRSAARALARLEKALDVRLVQRTTRSFALTDAGRTYYGRVRGAVAEVAGASEDAADRGDELRGTIRVTAPVDLGQVLLAEVVVRFTEKHAQVRFDVALTSRVVDLVAEGFDLALRASILPDSTLVARKLGPAHMGLFASPAYLARKPAPARVEDLASHDFVTFRASGLRTVLTLLGPDGEKEVRPAEGAIVSDDLLFVSAAVAAGAGIGLLRPVLRRLRGGRRASRVGARAARVARARRAAARRQPGSGRTSRGQRARLAEFVLSEAKRKKLQARRFNRRIPGRPSATAQPIWCCRAYGQGCRPRHGRQRRDRPVSPSEARARRRVRGRDARPDAAAVDALRPWVTRASYARQRGSRWTATSSTSFGGATTRS